jgi:hypothetical protein
LGTPAQPPRFDSGASEPARIINIERAEVDYEGEVGRWVPSRMQGPSRACRAQFFRGGDEGMTFLAYGTRRPKDVCYYPRSNKIFWRGVIARLEPLDYEGGEPED